MRYVGVDYHKQSSYVTVVDEQGEVVKQGSVSNSRAALAAFLGEGLEQVAAVVEAGRNWPVRYEWLEELVAEVTLAHPAKVRVMAEAKIKSDRLDAERLAQLLRAQLIPAAYAPGRVTREQRRKLRHRMFWVRVATMIKNRLHVLLDRHPELGAEAAKFSDLFGRAGRQWLSQLELAGVDQELLARDLAVLEVVQSEIQRSNRWVARFAGEDARARLLRTMPGIGDFFAALLAVEIDQVGRLARPQKLAAYAGLVPSTYASGGYVHHGRITKRGNKWIRWACVEAVYPAIRQDPDLRCLYQRLKRAKGANVAKVAVARRLLVIAYRLLSESRPYRSAAQQAQPRKRCSPAAPVAA